MINVYVNFFHSFSPCSAVYFFALCSFDSLNKLFIYFYVFFSITFHPISFTIISSYMLFFVFCLFQIISQEINGFFASLPCCLSYQTNDHQQANDAVLAFLFCIPLVSTNSFKSSINCLFFCFTPLVMSYPLLFYIMCVEKELQTTKKKCALIFFFIPSNSGKIKRRKS